MKKSILLLSFISFFLLSGPVAFGDTFTGTIINLPSPSLIESFFVDFNVTEDFAYEAFTGGSAVPPINPSSGIFLSWRVDDIPNSTFLVDLWNGELLEEPPPNALIDGIYNVNNLLNGQLFSFNITQGSIEGVSGFGAFDVNGDQVPYDITANLSTDGIIFNAVPIPSTILLLGGALLALVGLRRRS